MGRCWHRIVAIYATDGALGTKRLDSSPIDLGATRARELAAALSTRGYPEMTGRGLDFGSGGKIEIAEGFYALNTGRGHFDNQRQLMMEMMEMMGAPPEDSEMG